MLIFVEQLERLLLLDIVFDTKDHAYFWPRLCNISGQTGTKDIGRILRLSEKDLVATILTRII